MRKALIIPILFLSTKASAHFVWLEASYVSSDKCAVEARFGEYNNGLIEEKDGRLGEFEKILITESNGSTIVPLVSTMEQRSIKVATKIAQGSVVTALSNKHAVVDYTKHKIGIVRPIFSARVFCGEPSSKSLIPSSNGLDVLPKNAANAEIGKQYEFAISFLGEALKDGAKVFAIAPNGWMKEVEPVNGVGSFTPLWEGLYVIDVVYLDNKSGMFENVAYESIRYRATLSLQAQKAKMN